MLACYLGSLAVSINRRKLAKKPARNSPKTRPKPGRSPSPTPVAETTPTKAKMSASEKFCLKSNDFEPHLSTAFHALRYEDDFYDITLASDDHQPEVRHTRYLGSLAVSINKVKLRPGK